MGHRSVTTTARKVVVKVGSSSLVGKGGTLDDEQFARLADEMAEQRAAGRQVVLVSSGAIAAGRSVLGLKDAPRTLPLKQACAAAGQPRLMHRWETAFGRHGAKTAQVLLTRDITSDRGRYVHAQNTIEALLKSGVVPIVNENDTVAVEEIQFGDNDYLAALVTTVTQAELLILLTDTEGLFTSDPNRDADAQRIPHVPEIDADVLERAGDPASGVGRGGMRSKVRTAAMASAFGVATVVAHGREEGVLRRVLSGADVGTFFAASRRPMSSRKHWIAYSTKPRGTLVLDTGAVSAVEDRGSSILPSGIVGVAGRFEAGDTVRCLAPDGREVARGLAAYGVDVLVRLCGLRTEEIRSVLGPEANTEAIHRDDLVVLDAGWLEETT